MEMMNIKGDVGISPVLLQAITHTLSGNKMADQHTFKAETTDGQQVTCSTQGLTEYNMVY